MSYENVIGNVAVYVKQLFAGGKVGGQLPYHNLPQTEKVVSGAQQIANHYQLSDHDFFVVLAAAWFHDTGYYADNGEHHEEKSAAMAEIFLKEESVDDRAIGEIKQCILATQIPQRPHTLPEKIICDADLYYLGTDDFGESDKLLRKEFAVRMGTEIGKKEWREGTLQIMQLHQYHTDYCQLLLTEKKQENLEKIVKKQNGKKKTEAEVLTAGDAEKPAKKEGKIKEKKVEKPVRGIETMFRITSSNHQKLSDMADSKAHIMISVNSIIISVVLSLLVRRLETAPNLITPTLLLLTGTLIAVIFSVLATRPKIPPGSFSQEQLESRKVNLLFFGNFYKMDFDHYYEGMQQVMNDSDFLYASLIRDIHSQGIVLGSKYKLLRISYTVFMFTLIVAIAAFGIAIIFFG